ncbi:hypothetical protein K1T71_010795 [Dendrolimus kikuchii]|uniref:Uncharacterized protein n=1 Tax=Dendrolimus kikuchii TaxID=765133 RepID=A0ACC1CQ89_9NEOP|nr:hypothetical protein K1T71_010795 [Dendrolimus kikuchii]
MISRHWKLFVALMLSHIISVFGNNCCPEGQYVLQRNNTCWEPVSNVTTPIISVFCKDSIKMFAGFQVNKMGNLELELSENYVESFGPSIFCVGNQTNMKDVNLTKVRSVVIICIEEEEKAIIDDKILGYCMIISVIFLTATTVIYAALPELRDLHGKSLINFCGSLAIGLAILVMIKIMEYIDMDLCAVRGFLTYFFILTSFFWSNAISIQVLRNTRCPTISDYGWREFVWYALYAWGCPALLTIIMAIINFHPGKHQKPGIGLNHCWFFSQKQQWYYMYSVMTILLIVNICIFIYTSIVIWRYTFTSNLTTALKYKFVLTVRLIIVMGLPWIFEMISTFYSKHIFWAIMDVFNALQGVLIFLLLVVCRKRVLKAMHRHGWLDCVSGQIEKFLATADDEEENVIQHTDVPMIDGNGR